MSLKESIIKAKKDYKCPNTDSYQMYCPYCGSRLIKFHNNNDPSKLYWTCLNCNNGIIRYWDIYSNIYKKDYLRLKDSSKLENDLLPINMNFFRDSWFLINHNLEIVKNELGINYKKVIPYFTISLFNKYYINFCKYTFIKFNKWYDYILYSYFKFSYYKKK